MKAYLKRAHAVIAAALPKKKQAELRPLRRRGCGPRAAFDTSAAPPASARRSLADEAEFHSSDLDRGKPMKVPVNSIRAGNVIEYNGKLWVASKVQHISPGKGGAFVAIEAKALREGNKLQERFRSGETIEHVHIDERDCTYLFKDDNGFTFMDKENYEQLTVGADVLDPDQSRFLQDGMEVTVSLYEGTPVGVELPKTRDPRRHRGRRRGEGPDRLLVLQARHRRRRHPRDGAAAHRRRHQAGDQHRRRQLHGTRQGLIAARWPFRPSPPETVPSPASVARPMAPGRERSGPPERRSLAPRSATITVMIRAAFAAAKNLKRDFGEVEHLQISEKGPGDFVSHADIKAERTLRAELARTRPEYGFLGEEGGETKGDGRNRWIVDPLDGTTNFLHGVPHFAISIGLERDGEIIAGVIYQPISDELFWAEKGNGAFVDTPNARSRRLRVSGRKDPARALVGTGIPNIGKGDHADYHAQARGRDRADRRRAPLGRRRRSTSPSWRPAATTPSSSIGLAPWDVAAGLLLVREAGGIVSDIAGKPYELGGPSVLASNFGLREPMVEILGA